MPSPTEITVPQLSRLIGLPGTPVLIDVRSDDEFIADPRLVPSAQRHASKQVSGRASRYAGGGIVVLCQRGNVLEGFENEVGVGAKLVHGARFIW